MRIAVPWGRMLAGLAAAALLAMPAGADIKAFNAAVQARDYARANAEAAATWPTLDKSRKDIAIIAREFGVAAYMARDYAAARTYAAFAAGADPAALDPDPASASSLVLLRLAEYRQKATTDTRNNLFDALKTRSGQPAVDVISYLGLEALVTFDFDAGRWQPAKADAQLAVAMTDGDAAFLVSHRRFMLYDAVADYMDTKAKEIYPRFKVLEADVTADINGAASEADAERLLPVYWEVYGWGQAVENHLVTRRQIKPPNPDDVPHTPPTDRERRLLDHGDRDAPCGKKMTMKKFPEYPQNALFRGMLGVVVVDVAVNDKGVLYNPKILAAVPSKYFGDAVLKGLKDFTYGPGERWSDACSLAEDRRIITFRFSIPG